MIAYVYISFIKQADSNPGKEQSLHVNLAVVVFKIVFVCHSKALMIISILKGIIYKGFLVWHMNLSACPQ